MTTTPRAAFAACLFTAIVAGSIAPGFASAHQRAPDATDSAHEPEAPVFELRRDPDSPHDSIVVSWDASHHHPAFTFEYSYNGSTQRENFTYTLIDYRIFARDAQEQRLDPWSCAHIAPNRPAPPPDGCIRRTTSLSGQSRYSETLTGLLPGRTYHVWVAVTWRATNRQYEPDRTYSTPHDTNLRLSHKVITMAASPTQTTPTSTPNHTHPLPTHTHAYAAAQHSHGTPLHSHGYAPAVHTHRYAAADHTHAAGSDESAPASSSTPATAQTCPRFIELVSPWTFTRGYARELVTGSVWIAVHAIEYMRERTVPIVESARNGSDEIEGVEIRLIEAQGVYPGSGGGSTEHPRSFILDGAVLADVASSVRCTTGPVTTTVEATE